MESTTLTDPQYKGKTVDIQEERQCGYRVEAVKVFSAIRGKLLNPVEWEALLPLKTAAFRPVDRDGNILSRQIREGDYLQIGIAGPGNKTGHGYDWVQVCGMEDRREDSNHAICAIQLCPASAPGADTDVPAHFFEEGASSTLIVQQENSKVTLSYHGRNEAVNTPAESVAGNIRNAIAGTAAIAGLSELHWKSLIKILISL